MSSNNLFRVLKSGSAYNALIPKSTCEKVSFGKGDTHFSIEMIVKQALQHNKQVEKLAPKLKAESGAGTLQEICYRVHQFLYWHLQYKADGEAQLLRSPACAWQQRKDGIDCKSYSIFASAILLQLGIKHYIRKIKQPTHNPEHYSHVYVIVPKNQDTGNLDKGYYTIDGTLQHITEPIYTQKKDFFMDRLPHYGLNGVHSLGNSFDFKGLFKDLKFDKLFNSISCWGGTAFDATILKGLIPEISKYFIGIIEEYNQAIAEKRFSELHAIYMKFWQRKQTLLKVYHVKYQSKDWNNCSDASFIFVFDFLNAKIGNVLGNAFLTHFNQYFQVGSDRNNSIQFTQPANMPDTFDGVYMWGTAIAVPVSDMTVRDWDQNPKQHTYSVNVTPKTNEIPAFIITPELQQAINSDVKDDRSFNTAQFLQTLVATAPLLIGGTGTGNGQIVYDQNNPIQPKTSQAGFGVLGWLLVLAGLGFAFTKMKDKGAGAKKK